MGNRTHGATYGMRDRQCPRCRVLLRKEDFSGDLCNWCVYELSTPAWLLQVKGSPITRPPSAPPHAV